MDVLFVIIVGISIVVGAIVGYFVCFAPSSYYVDPSEYNSAWDDEFEKEWQAFRKSLED